MEQKRSNQRRHTQGIRGETFRNQTHGFSNAWGTLKKQLRLKQKSVCILAICGLFYFKMLVHLFVVVGNTMCQQKNHNIDNRPEQRPHSLRTGLFAQPC